MKKELHVFVLAVLALVHISLAETVYFLAADSGQTKSFVVPMTDPNHIAHARDLITYGPSIGRAHVGAEIACGIDGVNRNLIAPTRPLWDWHITRFIDFFDVSIPELPMFMDLVCDCPQYIADNGPDFGAFTDISFTIIQELASIDGGHWQCDFIYDDKVNMLDMAVLGSYWLADDCAGPDWCGGVDFNHNGIVDMTELNICATAWLGPNPYNQTSYWYAAWSCPTQCHGDVDCSSFINVTDLNAALAAMNSTPGGIALCDGGMWPFPAEADFDRDCDVDADDLAIIEYWYDFPVGRPPADCPVYP